MEKEITMILDKCHEELTRWSIEHLREWMIVSVFGEGLHSNHNDKFLKIILP